MGSTDLSTIIQLINLGGTVSVLAWMTWAFVTGKILSAATVKEIRDDRDDWKEIALTGAEAATQALNVAQNNRRVRTRRV